MSTHSTLRYEAALKVTGSAIYEAESSCGRHVACRSRAGADQLRRCAIGRRDAGDRTAGLRR